MFILKFLKDFLLGGNTIWYVIILGAISYLWFDYQDTKRQNVILQQSVDTALAGIKKLQDDKILDQKINDNSMAAVTAAQKEVAAIAAQLSAEVERLRGMKRPPEQANCTMHPAMKATMLDIRKQRSLMQEASK